MPKKALILDLDNTIYPVHAIGNQLFDPMFNLISQNHNHKNDIEKIKDDVMRKPFQVVAAQHQFDTDLLEACLTLLQNLTYESEIAAFSDYSLVKTLQLDKFLVTTGFPNLQQSKVRQLGIQQDFKEIHIVDPTTSNQTKKDVFADIIKRHSYNIQDILVVGDDPNSEINAAIELGIDIVLYDKQNLYPNEFLLRKINNYKQLAYFLA